MTLSDSLLALAGLSGVLAGAGIVVELRTRPARLLGAGAMLAGGLVLVLVATQLLLGA